MHTRLHALASFASRPSGTLCKRVRAELFNSGQTLPKIITAIKSEHSGSDQVHPYISINMEDVMTPTLNIET